ncbi:MAG TPA: hypothetical protein VD998_00180, partial [Verrucomicrobiae bacterium]|nr:hypothetical protein [Verrucomicrobiae bacterium]
MPIFVDVYYTSIVLSRNVLSAQILYTIIITISQMFHVKQLSIFNILFYILLFLIPINLRIIYLPDLSYIDYYFSIHLGFILYLTDLLLTGLLVSWLVITRPKLSYRQIFAFGLVLLFASIQMFHVKHTELWLYNAFKWLELLGLCLFLSKELKESINFKTAFLVLFLSGVFQASLGLWQFHVQHMAGLGFLGEYIADLNTPGVATIEISGTKLLRAYGTFPHPNLLGAFLVLGLILGYYYVSRETFRNKLLVSCGTLVISLGLFLTFSRIAWFGALVGISALTLWLLRHRRYQSFVSVVVLSMVSCGTVVLLYSDLLALRVSE